MQVHRGAAQGRAMGVLDSRGLIQLCQAVGDPESRMAAPAPSHTGAFLFPEDMGRPRLLDGRR